MWVFINYNVWEDNLTGGESHLKIIHRSRDRWRKGQAHQNKSFGAITKDHLYLLYNPASGGLGSLCPFSKEVTQDNWHILNPHKINHLPHHIIPPIKSTHSVSCTRGATMNKKCVCSKRSCRGERFRQWTGQSCGRGSWKEVPSPSHWPLPRSHCQRGGWKHRQEWARAQIWERGAGGAKHWQR